MATEPSFEELMASLARESSRSTRASSGGKTQAKDFISILRELRFGLRLLHQKTLRDMEGLIPRRRLKFRNRYEGGAPVQEKTKSEMLADLTKLAGRFNEPYWRAIGYCLVATEAPDRRRSSLALKAARDLVKCRGQTVEAPSRFVVTMLGRDGQENFLAAWQLALGKANRTEVPSLSFQQTEVKRTLAATVDSIVAKDYTSNRALGLRGRENKETGTGEQTEGELLPSNKENFRSLPRAEIEALLAHGKTHTWNTRVKRGFSYHTDVFEYVRDTYRHWIPGLTQELLFEADSSIESYYKKRKSEAGLPPWLFIPAGAEARDLVEADPRRIVWREIERERSRKRRTRIVKPHLR